MCQKNSDEYIPKNNHINPNPFLGSKASWIWNQKNLYEMNNNPLVNIYMDFRHEFLWDYEIGNSDTVLYISADSDYVVFLNGEFIDCGQYDDFPTHKVYDALDISGKLLKGRNVLSIFAYYQGDDSFQYKKGNPGLIYILKRGEDTLCFSGDQVLCRQSPAWKSGRIASITGQLGFTFEFDARNNDGCEKVDYIPDDFWQNSLALADEQVCLRERMYLRPIRKLELIDKINSRIISQGSLIRKGKKESTPAQLIQSDFLSYCHPFDFFTAGITQDHLSYYIEVNSHPQINFDTIDSDGAYIVLDLGKEHSGLFTMDICASEGTILDIGYGQHLEDLRVRAFVGGRNFAHRYICRGGKQEFTYYYKRFGCRYIQIHITNSRGNFILNHAGLLPWEYPVVKKGNFSCSDSLHSRIHEVSVRTLHLCMHEHYEDTEWREQALYAMDSRNQALCGYYCFGEYDMPKSSFTLLGMSMREDGFLEICAPASYNRTIPSFTMAWVIEVWEYILYSGDVNYLDNVMPLINKMMDIHMSSIKDGLLPNPMGDQYWNFYEWSEGMDGSETSSNPSNIQYDAPYNLLFYLALEAASMMAQEHEDKLSHIKYVNAMQLMKDNFHTAFWDEDEKAYLTSYGDQTRRHFAELTQALAICAGMCPLGIDSLLRKKLSSTQDGSDSNLTKCTISHSLYKYEALMGEPEVYGHQVFQEIAEVWGHMLYNGATSFWETIKGARDFNWAGSLCHGWSAIPIYFYYRYILGVFPLKPGFKEFKATPLLSIFGYASGEVPTPAGNIEVSLDKINGEEVCLVKHPQAIKKVI